MTNPKPEIPMARAIAIARGHVRHDYGRTVTKPYRLDDLAGPVTEVNCLSHADAQSKCRQIRAHLALLQMWPCDDELSIEVHVMADADHKLETIVRNYEPVWLD